MQGHAQPKLSKPMALLCYLCGKEYGSSSLKIHMKTCVQLWQNENPKKSLPDPPDLYEWVAVSGKASKAERQAYNSQATSHLIIRRITSFATLTWVLACTADTTFIRKLWICM